MYKGAFEASSAATRAKRRAARQEQKQQPENKTQQPKKPARQTDAPAQSAPKRRPRVHTVVFYSIYLVCILACVIAFHYAMGLLDNFLVKYEASQPDVKSQEVFEELFSQPDWASLYQMAGQEDTAYDGVQSYVAYMENKVGSQQLTFVETSVGLSQDKKFLVRLADETVASFSLSNTADAVAIPEWELSGVEIVTSYEESVTVHTYPGYIVQVNGVALDESFVVMTTTTAAEEYLPEGLAGPQTVSYYLDDLMVAPTVTVLDAGGKEVALEYDEEANAYSHEIGATSIVQEQTDAFTQASETYGKFMIADIGAGTLKKYFTGNAYDNITQAELAWMQSFSGYEFGQAQITEFYAYSDSFCSARVNQILYVTRSNGTVKEYEINSTFFMEKETDGDWMVVEMTNANVQKTATQVRLRFYNGSELVAEMMTDSAVSTLTLPQVEVPEGKTLAGWFTQSVNEEGKTVMTRVFQPDANGQVQIPAGYTLEPMELYARFENGGSE